MAVENSPKPLPAIDELTKPFWQAAAQHQLALQRCQDCNYFNHPPRPLCDACLSQRLEFVPVSGRGTVYSYTVMHQPNIAGFEKEVPYINMLVELDEQPRLFMVSFLPISERDKIRIGGKVEVTFDKINDEVTLPQFRLA
ncbi:MAG: hypothetical protein FJ147_09840 [Deltaproteobacteria bacterium]|nr:hypothetical protein [Deltaproteobacteria bacterium]